MLPRVRRRYSIQVEEMAGGGELSVGEGWVYVHADDGPELEEAPVPRLLMALLRLPKTVVDIGEIGASLDFDRNGVPEALGSHLFTDDDVGVRRKLDKDPAASGVPQNDPPWCGRDDPSLDYSAYAGEDCLDETWSV